MCTVGQCRKMMGQWVRFQTPWGQHRGVITDMNQRAVLMRVPRQHAPFATMSANHDLYATDEEKLDLALTQWGGYGGGYGGYGPYGGVGRWGYPGYYGYSGGWAWWWLAFAWIFALAFLW